MASLTAAAALEISAQAAAAVPAPQVGRSLARRHRARILGAEHAAAAAAPAQAHSLPGPAATEYENFKAALGVDLRRLGEIQSLERKIELKRVLLPTYDDWVLGVLDADAGGEDVIVTHIMIWAIDIGDYKLGLDLADYVLRHKLALPDRFDRTPATLIVEEIAEAALVALGKGDDDKLAPFADGQVLSRIDLIAELHDMPDQVRAKCEKVQGRFAQRAADAIAADADGPAGAKRGQLEIARKHYARALELDDTVGVKGNLKEVERAIARLTTPEGS
jgi:hypothetical protein